MIYFEFFVIFYLEFIIRVGFFFWIIEIEIYIFELLCYNGLVKYLYLK